MEEPEANDVSQSTKFYQIPFWVIGLDHLAWSLDEVMSFNYTLFSYFNQIFKSGGSGIFQRGVPGINSISTNLVRSTYRNQQCFAIIWYVAGTHAELASQAGYIIQ